MDLNSGKFELTVFNKFVKINENSTTVKFWRQVVLQDNEKEREVLRREVVRSQEQVRHLIGSEGGASWSSPLSPLSPMSPLPSPFTSKSSSPPLSDTGDRLSALSLLSR